MHSGRTKIAWELNSTSVYPSRPTCLSASCFARSRFSSYEICSVIITIWEEGSSIPRQGSSKLAAFGCFGAVFRNRNSA